MYADDRLNGKKTCMNIYDVRLVDDWPACGMNWPPDLPDVYQFLRVSFPAFNGKPRNVQLTYSKRRSSMLCTLRNDLPLGLNATALFRRICN